jgi:CheY-like chemotaxis protein
MRNYLVQTSLTVLSLALMFILYKILRHREREMEREKAKAKSYFFSTVSHDIRTPLNAIIGFTEMLQQGFKTEEERAQALDAILVSGRSLLGLINDVLDLSKLESGKMEITPEPTDCPRLMRELMDAFRASSSTPGLELRCRAEAMPPLMLDPQRLRQIVFNLVGNAVKFTATGYVELRVSYERPANAETGLFRLEVEDTGCGISDEDKKHIGNAYVQVGAKQSRNGGTGLGLAICQQLAAAMGGRLGVVSELGHGSTFSIEIPGVRAAGAANAAPAAIEGRKSKVEDQEGQGIVPAATPVEGQRSKVEGREGLTPPSSPVTRHSSLVTPSTGAKRRILVVDDAKLNAMVLKALLKNLGDFDIAVAMDGQEALAAMTAPGSVPFDLVLTDMWMPNLDGEGLVRAIRKDPALASTRVIVVTADVEMRTKAVDMGFDDILLKPVTSERLAKALAGEVGSASQAS